VFCLVLFVSFSQVKPKIRFSPLFLVVGRKKVALPPLFVLAVGAAAVDPDRASRSM
jgi:hypothetical protein